MARVGRGLERVHRLRRADPTRKPVRDSRHGDLSSLGLSPAGLLLARALQDYAAYVGDTSSQVTLYAEPAVQNNHGAAYNQMLADWSGRLRSQFRAVTNSFATTIGGGKRRQPAAAALTVPTW